MRSTGNRRKFYENNERINGGQQRKHPLPHICRQMTPCAHIADQHFCPSHHGVLAATGSAVCEPSPPIVPPTPRKGRGQLRGVALACWPPLCSSSHPNGCHHWIHGIPPGPLPVWRSRRPVLNSYALLKEFVPNC